MGEFELALHPEKTRLIRSAASQPSSVPSSGKGSQKRSTSSASVCCRDTRKGVHHELTELCRKTA